MINFGMEADDTNPVISRKVHARSEDVQKTISELIRQGIKAGEFKPGWDDKEFATIMFAMIEGAVVIGRVAGSKDKAKIVAKRLKQMIMEQAL